MTIEWAPISVDGSHNPEVRRHARSLAMRQYRQRQKEELGRKTRPTVQETENVPSAATKKKRRQQSATPPPTLTANRKGTESKLKPLVFNARSWRENVEERIQNPKVIADSLLLCKRYLQWLNPRDDLTDSDFALFVAQQTLPDPLLIAASHLVAGRYLDAVHFRPSGKKCNERKTEVLTSLKARLSAKETPLSADIISAVVCLLHFELCEGNEEALVHLQGIKALMGATDSSNSHLFASCAMSLEMGDLVHALMFSYKAEFVTLGKQNPHDTPTYSSYHTSVLAQELDHINKLISYPYFSQVDSTMHSVSRSIEQSFGNAKVQAQGSVLKDLAKSRDSLLVHQSPPCDLEVFVQAAQATIMIIYRVAVLKHSFNDVGNQAQVDSVINAMLHVPSERWRVLKYFRLFMLLAAVCASEEPRRRSFCEAHLVRAMLNIGPEAWLATRKFVVKFINNVNAVRGPSIEPNSFHIGYDHQNSNIEQHNEAVKYVSDPQPWMMHG